MSTLNSKIYGILSGLKGAPQNAVDWKDLIFWIKRKASK